MFKGVLLRDTYGISEQAERHKSQSFKNRAKKILRNLFGTSYNVPLCKVNNALRPHLNEDLIPFDCTEKDSELEQK